MSEYFKSKIYNNGKYFSLDEPAFSIVSNEDNYGINEAIDFANKIALKNIFIVFSGQQTLGDQYVNDYGDLLFCSRLTGGNRIGRNPQNPDESWWFGEYTIRNSSNPKYRNVVGDLYNECQADSLIINVLNTKYDWQIDPFYFTMIQDCLKTTILNNIYSKLNTDNQNRVKFTICGFSRGGVLSLRLVEIFQRFFGTGFASKIASVVTVDPVLNPLTENDLIDSLIIKKGNKWVRRVKGSFVPDYFSQNLVPVLKSHPGIKYYNMFQRKAWTVQVDATKKPIGSAIFNAETLMSNVSGTFDSDVSKDMLQYDMGMNSHTPEMLAQYSDSVLKRCLENRVV